MGRVIVVTTAELADGYRLAGVSTEVAEDAVAAVAVLTRLIAAGENGVVAVHEAHWEGLPAALRRDCETRLVPLVIPLPAGAANDPLGDRTAAMRSLVAAAVGFEFTFDVQGETP